MNVLWVTNKDESYFERICNEIELSSVHVINYDVGF